MEFNVCRWLIFSNHTSALPLTEADRRFNVVRNDASPMLPEYYKALYAALNDPDFINAVGQYLRTRDISGFNPGAHATMSEAKQELVAVSRSEWDETLMQLVNHWPSDVIANSVLGAMVTNQPNGKLTKVHNYALERACIRKYKSPIKVGDNTTTRVSILRNHPQWESADAEAIRAELGKPSPQLQFGNPRGCLEELMAV